MLRIMMLRKKLQTLQDEATALRAKQLTFKTREGELAAQIEEAKTEEEVSAVSAAVVIRYSEDGSPVASRLVWGYREGNAAGNVAADFRHPVL